MSEKVQERLRNRPRTWLVTGAAGFVGSHLHEGFLKLERRVVPQRPSQRYPHLRDLHPVYREFRAGDVRLSRADYWQGKSASGLSADAGGKRSLACALDW